jgi:hypothetical protein
MGSMAVFLLLTVLVCYVLVRIMPTRGMAVPFFWLGAWALASLAGMPFVLAMTSVMDAMGWRR